MLRIGPAGTSGLAVLEPRRQLVNRSGARLTVFARYCYSKPRCLGRHIPVGTSHGEARWFVAS